MSALSRQVAPENTSCPLTEVVSQFPASRPTIAAPDVTIITKPRQAERLTASESNSDSSEGERESEETKEQIYESLNALEAGGPKVDLRPLTMRRREDTGLYAKVKKLSGVTGPGPAADTNTGPNLNSDFVSIYELTKVESSQAPPSDRGGGTEGNSHLGTDQLAKDHPRDSHPQTKTKSNFAFALDFSAKREINKVSFASFDPDNDGDIMGETNDGGPECSGGGEIDYTSDEERGCNSNKTSNNPSFFHNKIENYPVQSDPIPKMQMNMFIQKDGKLNGSKRWPKVETPFCKQNRLAEVGIFLFDPHREDEPSKMRGFSEYLINNGNVCLGSISNHILNSQECISGRLRSFIENLCIKLNSH